MKKEIILTGDRPTGKLHLGHYAGSLINRVKLQETHDQTILIADMQALTDNALNPEKISSNIINLVADYLAVGIDPLKTRICLQSKLPALAELTMFYSNIVTVSRLERNPTIRSEIKDKGFERLIPVGFLNYPISQAADITAFNATLVPVGEDQLPIIEQTNEIVLKMNRILKEDVLFECRALLSDSPRLPSLNGKGKMSKSMGGVINFDITNKELKKMINKMYTDPNHININDKGNINGNVVFDYLKAFYNDKSHLNELISHYERGGLGDGKTKEILFECLVGLLSPIREKREELMSDKGELINILKKGTLEANKITNNTSDKIKLKLGLSLF